jgi:hypothetical protein
MLLDFNGGTTKEHFKGSCNKDSIFECKKHLKPCPKTQHLIFQVSEYQLQSNFHSLAKLLKRVTEILTMFQTTPALSFEGEL